MEYILKNGDVIGYGHTMFIFDVVQNLNYLERENNRLKKELEKILLKSLEYQDIILELQKNNKKGE